MHKRVKVVSYALEEKWNADLPELGVKRNMKNYFTFEKTPGGLAFRAFFGDF